MKNYKMLINNNLNINNNQLILNEEQKKLNIIYLSIKITNNNYNNYPNMNKKNQKIIINNQRFYNKRKKNLYNMMFD